MDTSIAPRETEEERIARLAAVLRELVEIGMRLARLAEQRAVREDEEHKSAHPPTRTAKNPGEAMRTFARLADALRLIVGMETRLAAGGPLRPVAPGGPAEPGCAAGPGGAGGGGPGPRDRDGRGDRLTGDETGFFARMQGAQREFEALQFDADEDDRNRDDANRDDANRDDASRDDGGADGADPDEPDDAAPKTDAEPTDAAPPTTEKNPAADPDWRAEAWERVRQAAFRKGVPPPTDDHSDAALLRLLENFSLAPPATAGPPGTGPPGT